MGTTSDRERREGLLGGDRGQWRRFAIEAGMLAYLVGLALVFVTSAPH
jgi:hypothetical protein